MGDNNKMYISETGCTAAAWCPVVAFFWIR